MQWGFYIGEGNKQRESDNRALEGQHDGEYKFKNSIIQRQVTRYSCSTRYKGSSVYILRKNFLWDLEMELIVFTASIRSGNDRRCGVILSSESSSWPAVSSAAPEKSNHHKGPHSAELWKEVPLFLHEAWWREEQDLNPGLRGISNVKSGEGSKLLYSNVLQSLASCLVWIAIVFQ